MFSVGIWMTSNHTSRCLFPLTPRWPDSNRRGGVCAHHANSFQSKRFLDWGKVNLRGLGWTLKRLLQKVPGFDFTFDLLLFYIILYYMLICFSVIVQQEEYSDFPSEANLTWHCKAPRPTEPSAFCQVCLALAAVPSPVLVLVLLKVSSC